MWSTSSVFRNHSPFSLELTNTTELASQRAPRILLYPQLQCWDCRHTSPYWAFYVGPEESNPGPCTANTLLTVPSPQPTLWGFKKENPEGKNGVQHVGLPTYFHIIQTASFHEDAANTVPPSSHTDCMKVPLVSQLSSPRKRTPTTRQCPESYLHVCQGGAEVLVYVGLEYRVKMLKLDVPYQRDDEDLPTVADISSSSTWPGYPAYGQESNLYVPFLS